MKRDKFKKLICAACSVVLLAAVLATGVQAKIYSDDELAEIARAIIERELSAGGYADTQAWLDSGMASEWYVIALRQSGEKLDLSTYADLLAKMYEMRSARSPVLTQKYALTMFAAGRGDDKYAANAADETIGAQGIMSYIFGLHLLTNGAQSENHTAESVISAILSLRLDDGGWSLAGTSSDVDITAMAVQSLAPYYGQSEDVVKAVDEAVELLAARQLDDGDFASYGAANAESVAQVIVALSSIGIDIQQDDRFIKNGNTAIDGMLKYRLPDGSFAHQEGGEYNLFASSQAYFSLISYLRHKNGRFPMFVFGADEGPLGSDVLPEDATGPEPVTESDVTEPVTASSVNADDPESGTGPKVSTKGSYKIWVILGVASAAAIVCALFWFTGRRNPKNFIFIIALATIASVIVTLVDIKTPEDYYTGVPETKENVAGHVTMSIRCDLLLGVASDEHIPSDGMILPATEFEISEGETVYDILVEAARAHGIHTDTRGANYVAGIGYIYEYDYGELSGWTYLVNGESPSVGCGEYKLSDGDKIEWVYTLALGDDIR